MQEAVGLLDSISEFCRRANMAESTFGRRAVNDGKFVARLRDGARITPETLERVSEFLTTRGVSAPASPPELMPLMRVLPAPEGPSRRSPTKDVPSRNFRFFDNRQKYLLFVNTCGEKETIARRVGLELAHLHPAPPAVRVFDAGMGDGTVLTRVMREMHRRLPTLPFYVVGKEISLEDARLSLEKMADRFHEHPATVLVVTNMYYTEAPWLTPKTLTAATSLVWHEVALTGSTAAEFSEQITALEPFLGKVWQAKHSAKTGNPVYERPVALVIYRDDFRFLLHDVIPEQGRARADYDLVIASQPYRARVPVEFKASKVVAPLSRALRPGGRLLGIHSCGRDPGLEIVRKVWPDEDPFKTSRHDILRAVRSELGRDARLFNFNAYADQRAVFRYDMHTLPSEIANSIGTSTLFAAWNAAVYVAQIDDERLAEVVGTRRYLDATREVLQAHGQLWFLDEVLRHLAQTRLRMTPHRPPKKPSSPDRDRQPLDIAAVAAEMVACGSLEMGADSPEDARRIAGLLPAGTPVYVNHLPRHNLEHTLKALIALREANLEPVPHVAARRIASREATKAFLEKAVRLAGVAKVLLIGGDVPVPAGPYAEGAALLRDGLLADCGLSQVALPGYPEGHPHISTANLNAALEAETRARRAAGPRRRASSRSSRSPRTASSSIAPTSPGVRQVCRSMWVSPAPPARSHCSALRSAVG